MDIYQIVNSQMGNLSNAEKNIMDYVLTHLDHVQLMSIRELAKQCFVSTTTIFRCVKKLGFDGYQEFQTALQQTESVNIPVAAQDVISQKGYRGSYLKNIVESIKVINEEKSNAFITRMRRFPQIFILATDLSKDIAEYIYQILVMYGYRVEFPVEDYQVRAIQRRIKRDDVILVFSYSGENSTVIHYLKEVFSIATPAIISFTRADNNTIQNMSDLNFYTFADSVSVNGTDITSRCGMLAVFEILMYQTITQMNHQNE